jgi:hypothetical protein
MYVIIDNRGGDRPMVKSIFVLKSEAVDAFQNLVNEDSMFISGHDPDQLKQIHVLLKKKKYVSAGDWKIQEM